MNGILIQEVITYLIVAFAVAYTFYQLIKVLMPSKNSQSGCYGCSGDCSVHELKKQ